MFEEGKTIMIAIIRRLIFLFFTSQLVLNSHGAEEINSLDKVGSIEWVQAKIEAYPELNWLLSEDVEHTQEGSPTQQENSWSIKLKGAFYPEFERTIATLVNLYLILDGSDSAFNRFVASQPKEDALTRENFEKLHRFAHETIASHTDGLKAVEIDLLLGDMGKTATARKLAKEFSIEEHDHDLFLGECLKKCPHIFPTFRRLSPALQEELKGSTALLHFGHLSHLEGGPEILTKLKDSGLMASKPKALDLQLLAHALDISGARAHEDNRGSKAFTNKTFLSWSGIKDALPELRLGSEKDVIFHYVKYRAGLLGLDPTKKEDCALVRVGSLMRLFTPQEGQAMKKAYRTLEGNQKDIITEVFNPFTLRQERTFTYIPALLVNFLNTAVKHCPTKEEAIQTSLQEGIVAIASFIKAYREGKSNQPYLPHVTLNFNKAAGQVRENFEIFSTHAFSIDQKGNVILNE